jgi:O-antigen ligase
MLLYISVFLAFLALLALAIKPRWGVLALFVTRPLVDAAWESPLLFSFKLTEIVSAMVPLIVLVRMITDREGQPFSRMPMKWVWLLWAADVFLFSSLIMFFQTPTDGVDILLRHLNGFAGYYMVQAYCRTESEIKGFAWALVIAGIFPVATGLYEIVSGVHWKITFGEEGIVRNIGLYHDAITIRYYALQTVMGLLLVSALQQRKPVLLQGLLLVYGVATLIVVKGAYSKSGTLIILSWLVLWPLLRKNAKGLLALAGSGIVLALYYSKTIMDSIGFIFVKEISAVQGQGNVDRTFAGRWGIWNQMMEEWRSLPVVNQMLGSGQVALGAHNDYLQILFHGGIVGLFIYVTLLCVAGAMILRVLLTSRDVLSIAALLAFVMWNIDAIGLVPSAYSGYQWFIWGLIGLGLRARLNATRDAPEETISAPPHFRNLLGAT